MPFLNWIHVPACQNKIYLKNINIVPKLNVLWTFIVEAVAETNVDVCIDRSVVCEGLDVKPVVDCIYVVGVVCFEEIVEGWLGIFVDSGNAGDVVVDVADDVDDTAECTTVVTEIFTIDIRL